MLLGVGKEGVLVQNGVVVEEALLVGAQVKHFGRDVVVGGAVVAESRANMRHLLVSSCLSTLVVVHFTLAGLGERAKVLEVIIMVRILLERFAQRRSLQADRRSVRLPVLFDRVLKYSCLARQASNNIIQNPVVVLEAGVE